MITGIPRLKSVARCLACGEPRAKDVRGRSVSTCGKEACLIKLQERNGAFGWPQVTGEIEADFRPHEIEPGDGKTIFRESVPDGNRGYGQSTMSWVKDA